MKTRSKRFLSLAPLCLALLGTTLLIEQPVKAEGSESRLEERVTKQRQFRTYDEGYEQGRKAGYEEGRKEGAPENPEENPNVQKNGDYHPSDERGPSDPYSDGFDLGYSQGWHKAKDGGDSDHQGSQGRDETQDIEQSTERSHGEESQSSGSKQDKVEESNDGSEGTQDQDKLFSDLLSVIENLITSVLNWFSLA
ncbi:Essential protein Yae1, N terminal [Streptococcus pyogenes]|uniref:hypothetical protein n=1 Tax=Streptococcus pyogenes TaxID=1314 RepID=UPI00109CF40C|nr:hypothetical protein [Streptococcus pyogenes]VHD76366.1 Essential protein Yae1, N terminal [Streptococcus pyogenes]